MALAGRRAIGRAPRLRAALGHQRRDGRARSRRSIAPPDGTNSSAPSSGSRRRRRTSSTPMSKATSATRCPACCRFDRTASGCSRPMATPAKASGAAPSPPRAAARPESRGRLSHLVEQPDRSPVAGADHARLGGAVSDDPTAPGDRARRRRWICRWPPPGRTTSPGSRRAQVLASVDAAHRGRRETRRASGRHRRAQAAARLGQARGRPRRGDALSPVRRRVWRRTFADEMGEALFTKFYEWAGAERPAGLYAILDEPQSKWFDDIGTDRSARNARRHLRARGGRRGAAPRRGVPARGARGATCTPSTSIIRSATPPSLGWFFDRGPSPMVGDTTTVMRVSHHRLRPFAAWEMPSWRQLFDVGAWDESRVVLPAGQSGHPLSPHYFDQNEMWRQGQYRPQPFSRAAVERRARTPIVAVAVRNCAESPGEGQKSRK